LSHKVIGGSVSGSKCTINVENTKVIFIITMKLECNKIKHGL